jgi:hypothetical protein
VISEKTMDEEYFRVERVGNVCKGKESCRERKIETYS